MILELFNLKNALQFLTVLVSEGNVPDGELLRVVSWICNILVWNRNISKFNLVKQIKDFARERQRESKNLHISSEFIIWKVIGMIIKYQKVFWIKFLYLLPQNEKSMLK